VATLTDRLITFLTPEDTGGGGHFGRFEAGLLVVIAVGMTFMQFAGSEGTFLWLFGDALGAAARRSQNIPVEMVELLGPRDYAHYHLLCLVHWVGCCLIGYVLIPCLYLRMMGQRIRDMYLGAGELGKHLKVYIFLYLLVITPVILVSFSEEYQRIYPFYPDAGRSIFDLITWEICYGIQFFALEFMFRGVMLSGLKKWLGLGAVFVMVVPYCMLHFMKTGSESLGAIIAGVVLGCLAMKYRSIWGGVLLHWLVAITMDVLSLLQQGKLPTRLVP
jgi:uncharacterized protein